MNYHNITYPDMNNGDGLRVVLWLSGCSHHCYNCQNPQTWDANSGIPFDESAKKELFRELDKDYISGLTLTGGDPLFESNLDGVLDLVTEINKRYNFQKVDSANPCKMDASEVKNPDKICLSLPNKSIWIYSGYSWEECQPFSEEGLLKGSKFAPKLQKILQKRYEILSKCDVMVDGRYIDSQRDIALKWRGSSNQRVIDTQKSLKENKIVLYCD